MRGNALVKLVDRYLGVWLLFVLSLFRRRHERPEPQDVKKIAVILFGALGDTILAAPALRLLRNNYSHSKIVFIASLINLEAARLIEGYDELCCLDIGSLILHPVRFARQALELRRMKFDVVLDLEKWIRFSALLSWFMNPSFSVGFGTNGQGRHFCYDAVVPKENKHVVENLLDVVKSLPLVALEKPTLCLKQEDPTTRERVIDKLRAAGLSAPNDSVVVVHIGAGSNPEHGGGRIWPLANFARLIRDLHSQGHAVVLTGTASEVELAESLARCGLDRSSFLNMIGRTTTEELASLLRMARLVVCGNCGVMHLAAAVGTPVVALHGPTDPVKWGPIGAQHTVIQARMDCVPCLDLGFEYGCTDYKCMAAIPYEEVWALVQSQCSHGI